MIYHPKISILNLDPKKQLLHDRNARYRKEVQRFCLISDRAITHIEYFFQFGPFSLKSSDLIIKINDNAIAVLNDIVRLFFSGFQITESIFQISDNIFIVAEYYLPHFTFLMS
jgi:hypothetical protein